MFDINKGGAFLFNSKILDAIFYGCLLSFNIFIELPTLTQF